MDQETKLEHSDSLREIGSATTMETESTMPSVMDGVDWGQGEVDSQSQQLPEVDDVDSEAHWDFKESADSPSTTDPFTLDVGMMTKLLDGPGQPFSVQSDMFTDSRCSTPFSTASGSGSVGRKGKRKREESDEDDDKEPLSYELHQGYRILKEIMSESNKSVNWPFMEAVDTSEGAFDYYDRVEKPIWMRKMKEKFQNREYQTITEYIADMRLMLENCYRYNGPDHTISKKGQRLETIMEQKLALLSRELRERTTIAATTGSEEEKSSVVTGTRRKKHIVPHDSTALLNQLRHEEQERVKEARRQVIQERKQAQEAYLQSLQSWEDCLFNGQLEQMKAMWEIPQIGHFLFLCNTALNLGEIAHCELERSFLMPRESETMQRVMTSLLSTPYQRTRLDKKPLMPYKVWEEKLRVRVRHWYKILADNKLDVTKACNKLGFENRFFEILGLKNPLERKKYHQLTFYQKVWIMKCLCDYCLETQESIREALGSQPAMEQHEYLLGTDADGNTYLHFPQFCGADLRIYRRGPIQMPKLERVDPVKILPKTPVSKGKRKKPKARKKVTPPPTPPPTTPRLRDSRLRQNPRTVTQQTVEDTSETTSSYLNSSPSSSEDENDSDGATSTSKTSRISIRKPLESLRLAREKFFGSSWSDSRDSTPCHTPMSSREATPTRNFRGRRGRYSRESTPTRSRYSRENTPSRDSVVSESGGKNRLQGLSRESSPARSITGKRKSPRGSSRRGRRGRRGRTFQKNAHSEMETDNVDEDADSVASKQPDSVSVTGSSCNGDGETDPHAVQNESNCDAKKLLPDDGCSNSASTMPMQTDKTELSRDKTSKSFTDSLPIGQSDRERQLLNGAFSDTDSDLDSAGGNSILPKNWLPSKDSNQQDEKADQISDQKTNETEQSRESLVGLNDETNCDKTVLSEFVEEETAKQSVSSGDATPGNNQLNTTEDLKAATSEETCADSNINATQSRSDAESSVLENSEPSLENIKQETKKEVVADQDIPSNDNILAPSCSNDKEQSPLKQETPPKDEQSTPMELEEVKPDIKVKSDSEIQLGAETVKQEKSEEDVPGNTNFKQERDDALETEAKLFGSSSVLNTVKQEKAEVTENFTESSDVKTEDLKTEEMMEGKEKSEVSSEQTDKAEGDEMKTEEIKRCSKEEEEQDGEPIVPEIGPFELIVEDVDSLRSLAQQFAEPEPVVIGTGKKQRVIKPAPRKKKVAELHDRLCYLLKELEPWEQKLIQARKKAKIKLRKEQEGYVEEEEKEQVEDVWESEESVSESSEESESEEKSTDGTESRPATPMILKRPQPKKNLTAEKQTPKPAETPAIDNELGVSSKGRVRKRRIIPDNIEDQGLRIPKQKKVEERKPEPTPMPNILQRTPKGAASGTQSQLQAQLQSALSQVQFKQLQSAMAGGGVSLISHNGQTLLVKGLNPTAGGQNPSLKNATLLAYLTANRTTSETPARTTPAVVSPAKQSVISKPNIAEQGVRAILKQGLTGQQQAAVVNPGVFIPGPAAQTATLPSKNLNATNLQALSPHVLNVAASVSAVSPPSVATQLSVTSPVVSPSQQQQQQTPSKPAAKLQCANLNVASQMPANIVQHLLKTQEGRLKLLSTKAQAPDQAKPSTSFSTANTSQTSAIQGLVTAQPSPAKSSDVPKAVLVGSNKPQPLVLPGSLQNAALLKSPEGVQYAVVATLPEGQVINTQKSQQQFSSELMAKLIQSTGDMHQKGQPVSLSALTLLSPHKPKYAGNVTVKALLESRGVALTTTTPAVTSLSTQILKPNVTTAAAATALVSPPRASTAMPMASISPKSATTVLQTNKKDENSLQQPAILLHQSVDKTGLLLSPGKPKPVASLPKSAIIGVTPAGQQQGHVGQVIKTTPAKSGQVVAVPKPLVQNLQQQLNLGGQSSLRGTTPQVAVSISNTAATVQKVLQPQKPVVVQGAGNILRLAVPASMAATKVAGSKQVVVANPAQIQALIAAKQKQAAIDRAVKTIITPVNTTLPTAHIKVSSPQLIPSRQSHRPLTIMTSAMKAPIPALAPMDSRLFKKEEGKSVKGIQGSIISPLSASTNLFSNIATTTLPDNPVGSLAPFLTTAVSANDAITSPVTAVGLQMATGLQPSMAGSSLSAHSARHVAQTVQLQSALPVVSNAGQTTLQTLQPLQTLPAATSTPQLRIQPAPQISPSQQGNMMLKMVPQAVEAPRAVALQQGVALQQAVVLPQQPVQPAVNCSKPIMYLQQSADGSLQLVQAPMGYHLPGQSPSQLKVVQQAAQPLLQVQGQAPVNQGQIQLLQPAVVAQGGQVKTPQVQLANISPGVVQGQKGQGQVVGVQQAVQLLQGQASSGQQQLTAVQMVNPGVVKLKSQAPTQVPAQAPQTQYVLAPKQSQQVPASAQTSHARQHRVNQGATLAIPTTTQGQLAAQLTSASLTTQSNQQVLAPTTMAPGSATQPWAEVLAKKIRQRQTSESSGGIPQELLSGSGVTVYSRPGRDAVTTTLMTAAAAGIQQPTLPPASSLSSPPSDGQVSSVVANLLLNPQTSQQATVPAAGMAQKLQMMSAPPLRTKTVMPAAVTSPGTSVVHPKTILSPAQKIIPTAAAAAAVKMPVVSPNVAKNATSPPQQKLVVYNVNGQLVTAQGIPVTISGGVLRQLSSTPSTTLQHALARQLAPKLAEAKQGQPTNGLSSAPTGKPAAPEPQKPAESAAAPEVCHIENPPAQRPISTAERDPTLLDVASQLLSIGASMQGTAPSEAQKLEPPPS